MRTKLVLGAAVLAAGLATSLAQNVYSLNVVGYVNLTAPPGYSLFANQLITASGTNGINEVLPNPALDNQLVLTFADNNYNADTSYQGAWVDYNTYNPSTTTLDPGKGWFYYNGGTATTLTLVGTVPQGSALTIPLPSGYSMIGTITPQALALEATNGCPLTAQDNNLFLSYDNPSSSYLTDVTYQGGWVDYNTYEPVLVAPAVGQGYFVYNGGVSNAWINSFTVQ